MRGVISFHPFDPGLLEGLIEPLLRGGKINPEAFLDGACQIRHAAWLTCGYKLALARLFEEFDPPPPANEGTLWDRVRTRLERFDYQAPPLSRLVRATLDPDLHLRGRPFLITEASPERAAEVAAEYVAAASAAELNALVLDQLGRLDPALARGVAPEPLEAPGPDAAYRTALLGRLRQVHDWGQAARGGQGGVRGTAADLRWRIVELHSRAVPFWVAGDVDGLGTICEAAGLEPPVGLGSAAGLFAGIGADVPELCAGLGVELSQPQDVGAYAAPERVPDLLAFLLEHGGRMIQVAARHGQGGLCAGVLRRIRECLRFAERHGVGYLEASGIHPPLEELLAETPAAGALAVGTRR